MDDELDDAEAPEIGMSTKSCKGHRATIALSCGDVVWRPSCASTGGSFETAQLEGAVDFAGMLVICLRKSCDALCSGSQFAFVVAASLSTTSRAEPHILHVGDDIKLSKVHCKQRHKSSSSALAPCGALVG
jgi:hypothetical protein